MLIAHITLKPSHRSTGKTRHVIDGEEMPRPSQLRVEQLEGDPGFYLFYCDETGDELSDTYHETLEGAFKQANWEFGIQPDEWTRPKPA